MPDGVLVIDKPSGVTSHDVVAVARRALGEKRIGHTGTLDPLATGVLPLACGRATRLVRFLTASEKAYEARIQFGVVTDSYDITGTEVRRSDATPSREAVEQAIESLRGEYLQMPPAFSAKKVQGQRAYALARRDEEVVLTPVPVRVPEAELLDFTGPGATVRLRCSAGFYVRSFAHSLGELVGTGATLAALRRTRSGDFGLEIAATLDDLRQNPGRARELMVPLERLLPSFPAAHLTAEGLRRVTHGQSIGPAHTSERPQDVGEWVRLLAPDGRLVALADASAVPGALHPAIVLI